MLMNAKAGIATAIDSELVFPGAGTETAIPEPLSYDNSYNAYASKRHARMWLRVALMAGDVIALMLAFGAATILRQGFGGFDDYATTMIVMLPLYLGIAFNGNAYDLQSIRSFRSSISRPLMALAFTAGAMALMMFFLKASAEFSRLMFGIGVTLAFAAIPALRYAVTSIGRSTVGENPFVELVIVDGVSFDVDTSAMMIDAAAHGLKPSAKDPNNIQRLGSYVRNVDRVIVACPLERRAKWAFVLKALDINAEIMVPELDDLGAIHTSKIGNGTTLVVSTGPLALRHRVTKRVFDLAFVLAAMPFLAIPMIITAILIKMESSGPVLFKQVRIGLGNRPFHILKFRSMRTELCDANGNRSAARDDDRITRVGRIIRATSMDELPQILNVLLGDMSIVGPRPHAVGSRAENMLFWDIDDRYWHRHAVKPGLTGLAQIRGFRGATELREDLSNRLQADLEYRSNWSLTRDISIILATFKVLVHRNAF